MTTEYGQVVAVDDTPLARNIVGDHTAGATTLTVTDVFAFDEDGGSLQINGQVIAYSAIDEDTDQITIDDALDADAEDDASVYVWDPERLQPSSVRVAQVIIDDEPGDPVEAELAAGLEGRLPLGTRAEPTEQVILELDDDVWRIIDILGQANEATLIEFPTGSQYEDTPGSITGGFDDVGGSDQGWLVIASPGTNSGGPGEIRIRSSSSVGNDGEIVFSAIQVVNNSGKFHCVGVTPGSSIGLEVDGFVKLGYGIIGDLNVETDVLGSAGDGIVTIGSLANGGANDQDFGARYCRVGPGGALYASATTPSSREIKHDVHDLDLDLDQLLKVRTVRARYNEAPDHARPMVIAEEVHALGLQLLVGYEDHANPTKPTGFDYDGLGVALLSLCQEQQRQIADLTSRITALEEG